MNKLRELTDIDPASWAYNEALGVKTEWTPRQKPRTVTASGMINALDDLVRVNATSGANTQTLESAVGCDGRQHTGKKIDASANAMILAAHAGELIDGAATVSTSTQYASITVKSNGIGWDIV